LCAERAVETELGANELVVFLVAALPREDVCGVAGREVNQKKVDADQYENEEDCLDGAPDEKSAGRAR
jgi:hypothetical protein